MKLLKNSTYEAIIKKENDLIEHNLRLQSDVNALRSEINMLNSHNAFLSKQIIGYTTGVRELRAENEALKIKADKYDKEVARLKLKNQIAHIKKMTSKQIAEKYLGMSVVFYDETPAIICGYTNKNVVICACNHEEKSWSRVCDWDIILSEHEKYVYFSVNKVALQIINQLKNQK